MRDCDNCDIEEFCGYSVDTLGCERFADIVKEHDKQISAEVIEEIKEAINNNGAYQMNPQITEYDKGSDDAFEIVLDILEQLKEQKNE